MLERRGRGRWGRSRGPSLPVVLLALLAGILLMGSFLPTGGIVLLFLGGSFTALSVMQGRGGQGFLVPGGILLGLGTGITLGSLLGHLAPTLGGASVVGGLGGGFWFIYLLDRARHPLSSTFAWARIPGTILLGVAGLLTVLGLSALTGQLLWTALSWWPVLLIVGGLGLFLANRRARRW